MRGAVRKMGNSSGVIIPKQLLTEIGTKVGDHIEMVVEAGRLVIAPIKTHPRAGWAEDAKGLAESRDDGLVWPEFSNEDDDKLEW
jgi:antitoxin MazE